MPRPTLLLVLAALCAAACSADVSGPNRPPVAVAGFDQRALLAPDVRVQLDGSASYDPDGDPLTRFRWRLLSRPAAAVVELQQADSSAAWLEPDAPGTYVVALVVDDGRLASAPDVLRLLVAGRTCEDDADCDDGQWCNGAETCQAGTCQPGQPVDCDDRDPCTEDRCDEQSDSCSHQRQPIPGAEGPEGDPTCDDNLDNDCDGLTDAADGDCGACENDAACDDGDPCTVDSCTEGSCTFAFAEADTPCDDGLFCNGPTDVCDGQGGCGPAADSQSPCTQVCLGICDEQADACRPDPAGSDCSDPGDGYACTADACDGSGRCRAEPIADYCTEVSATALCLPDCAADPSGCVEPPVDMTIDCAPGDPAACTITTPGLGDQSGCIACETEIAPTVLGATDFGPADGGGCDLGGWSLVAGDACSYTIADCQPQSDEGSWSTCCAELEPICVQSGDDYYLRSDYKHNCGDSQHHEWRLMRTFDTTGLGDLELCFRLAEHDANEDETLLVFVSDPDHAWPGTRVFCQADGPGVDHDDDRWYPFCVPLQLPGDWASDNPELTVTLVAYSDDDNDALWLDDLMLRGFPLASPRMAVDLFHEDFAGCDGQLAADHNGWTVTGPAYCPAFSECAASIPAYQGTPIQALDDDVVLEQRFDAALLDAQVRVCFWYGEDNAGGGEAFELAFEPFTGAGYITAYYDDRDAGPTACRRACVTLSDIDPRLINSPDLGLRLGLYSDSGDRPVALARLLLSGALLEDGAAVFELGQLSQSGQDQLDLPLHNSGDTPLTARVRCRWTPTGDTIRVFDDVLLDPEN